MRVTTSRLTVVLFAALVTLAGAACGQNGMQPDGMEQDNGPLRLESAFPNITFTRPVDFQVAPDGSDRVYVVEQRGVIRVFTNDGSTASTETFLDLTDRVRDSGNEEGLLGLAFHPNYAENGTFYVDYTASNPQRTVIARYSVDPVDPTTARSSSESIVLEVNQPYGNHNAGQIAFGPDGYLYVTMGDGGAGGDPQENGQDRTTLLGSILRIDVDGSDPYAIPADNPFAGNDQGFREEIYAYGLRNPWRISFDPQSGDLWTGDVGQNAWEEVDRIVSGGNYGWNTMEGTHCFDPPSGCERNNLIEPIFEYPHSQGSSITGGYVYRGSLAPSLRGRYVFADYVSGRIWGLTPDTGDVDELMDTSLSIASFGVDGDGELYILAFNGAVYRFTERVDGN